MTPLAKHTHAQVDGVRGQRLFKVLAPQDLETSNLPADQVLIWDPDTQQGANGAITVRSPRDPGVISSGDVVRLREGASLVSVVYRRGSSANVLFTTERCNSLCLMCSQPPREGDDSWRTEELLELIPLIDPEERQLGVTGGEPTLLGEGLAVILESCRELLPGTQLHVLTNGRGFRNPSLAEQWATAGGGSTMWAVPLCPPSAPMRQIEGSV